MIFYFFKIHKKLLVFSPTLSHCTLALTAASLYSYEIKFLISFSNCSMSFTRF